MDKIYYYQFNMKTQEIKILECNNEGSYFRDYYHLTTIVNGKKRRIRKRITNINYLEAERNGLFISACSLEKNKISEFKEACIEQLNEYKKSCEANINKLIKTINDCNNCINNLEVE